MSEPRQPLPPRQPRVNLTEEADRIVAARIGGAWKEMRRGAAMSALRTHLFGHGESALEPGQMDTLDLLVGQEEPWRMGDLADALRVDPSTATRAVQRLVKVGLASRTMSNTDGRVVMVTSTPAGRQRHAEVSAFRRLTMSRLLDAFEPDERRVLADYLERFVKALDDFVDELDDVD
jgi:DNA-binding MarR family transcriptional regulator